MWVYSTPVSHHHMQSFQAVREGTHSLVMPATACLCHIHLPSSSHYSYLLLPASATFIISLLMPATDCLCRLHHLIPHACY